MHLNVRSQNTGLKIGDFMGRSKNKCRRQTYMTN